MLSSLFLAISKLSLTGETYPIRFIIVRGMMYFISSVKLFLVNFLDENGNKEGQEEMRERERIEKNY